MCLWDSRFSKKDKDGQYKRRDWGPRRKDTIGQQNIMKESLVKSDQVLIPPLHVKLGVVKSFIKRIVERKEVFLSLRRVFPKRTGGLTDDRLKTGK